MFWRWATYFSFTLLVFAPVGQSADPPLGISYSEATRYMAEHFEMEANSYEGGIRHSGQSKDGLALLEIIGDEDNITEASLVAGIPPGDTVAMTKTVPWMIRFMKNTVPGWSGASDWVAEQWGSLMAQGGGRSQIVKGDRRITVTYTAPAFAFVNVKHKDSDEQ